MFRGSYFMPSAKHAATTTIYNLWYDPLPTRSSIWVSGVKYIMNRLLYFCSNQTVPITEYGIQDDHPFREIYLRPFKNLFKTKSFDGISGVWACYKIIVPHSYKT